MGRKWAAHMAGIVTLIDDVLDGAVGLLSQRPLGVPWRPQALRKPSCQAARGTFLSGGQSECCLVRLCLQLVGGFVERALETGAVGPHGGELRARFFVPFVPI